MGDLLCECLIWELTIEHLAINAPYLVRTRYCELGSITEKIILQKWFDYIPAISRFLSPEFSLTLFLLPSYPTPGYKGDRGVQLFCRARPRANLALIFSAVLSSEAYPWYFRALAHLFFTTVPERKERLLVVYSLNFYVRKKKQTNKQKQTNRTTRTNAFTT